MSPSANPGPDLLLAIQRKSSGVYDRIGEVISSLFLASPRREIFTGFQQAALEPLVTQTLLPLQVSVNLERICPSPGHHFFQCQPLILQLP